MMDAASNQLGYTFLGYLCPEDESIPSFGGSVNCDGVTGTGLMGFIKFEDLDQRLIERQIMSQGEDIPRRGTPEFNTEAQRLAAINVTTDDVFAYYAENVLSKDNEDTSLDTSRTVDEINNRIPITIDVVQNNATGQVVGQVEAELIEFTYTAENLPFSPSVTAYQVFLAYNGDGYTFGIDDPDGEVGSGEIPEELGVVMDTFRLIASPPSTTTVREALT